MEREFIPYQEALELKELGFDEPCFGYYLCRNSAFGIDDLLITTEWIDLLPYDSSSCKAPLYQQAFRWFREKYNIDSWIQPFTSKKSNGVLYLPDESYSYFIFKDGVWVDDKVDFLEPEEAELACLKKLIQIVKENKQ
jgi:hypothetical protein